MLWFREYNSYIKSIRQDCTAFLSSSGFMFFFYLLFYDIWCGIDIDFSFRNECSISFILSTLTSYTSPLLFTSIKKSSWPNWEHHRSMGIKKYLEGYLTICWYPDFPIINSFNVFTSSIIVVHLLQFINQCWYSIIFMAHCIL